MSGSDDSCVYIWCKKSAKIVKLLEVREVVMVALQVFLTSALVIGSHRRGELRGRASSLANDCLQRHRKCGAMQHNRGAARGSQDIRFTGKDLVSQRW